jgi:PadR family transcriptional regulator, regulatory protein AphA
MNSIEIAILGFLIEKEMHGYEVFKNVSDKGGFGAIYSIKIGRLYSILNKLEELDLIQSEINSAGSRPPKKVYKITNEGEQQFKIWLIAPEKHGRDIRINLLMKLFFAERIPEISEEDILLNQINECQEWLEKMNNETLSSKNLDNIQFIVQEFRKFQIEGYINWLIWCKRRIIND